MDAEISASDFERRVRACFDEAPDSATRNALHKAFDSGKFSMKLELRESLRLSPVKAS